VKEEKRDYLDYLHDILDAARDALEFTDDLTLEEFKKDRKTVYAATRAIEIIGEATKKLPKSLTGKYPDIPWKDMAGMRDKLIHGYAGVDTEVLWQTIEKDVPKLKAQIGKVLSDIEKK